ncbi:hypothetical protein BC833DRAFT_619492 [Globomyces pollinis-pini]|nr:hypothetical protein BC833DRAFT_619492 [Globomyces pollinis-pini]
MIEKLEEVISMLLSVPEVTVDTVSMVNMELKTKILSFGNGNASEIPFPIAHHAFEKMAFANPNLTALIDGDFSCTYDELNRMSDMVARQIMLEGLKPGSFIGILTKNSFEMIVYVFGILKAGSAFVPIDGDLPIERIQYILESSQCSLLLYTSTVDTALKLHFGDYNMKKFNLSFDDFVMLSPPEISYFDAAYVVFTSGSTGKPKGVVIPHISLANFANTKPNFLGVEKGDRVAQLASVGFDLCVDEIFLTLGSGGTLVIRDFSDYFKVLKNVDKIIITPTALMHMDPSKFQNLRTVLVAGENVPQSLLERWAEKTNLFNGYGPSETNFSSITALRIGKEITIGKPIQNTTQYILDKDLKLVPIGVPGELFIGGVCCFVGYLNRPDLTDEKYLADTIRNDGSKMYRTGDICKWNEDGDIQILGRVDDMIKLNGYRIELEEISTVLIKHPMVTGAVVMVKDDKLISYVTPDSVNTVEVRDYLRESLPVYMLPAQIVCLVKFPMNTNGKVDKNKLYQLYVNKDIELPTTVLEVKLAGIWSSLLGVSHHLIGKHSSFFEFGGDSLSAIKLVNECTTIGLNMTTLQVFRYSTLSQMAKLNSTDSPKQYPKISISDAILKEIFSNGITRVENVDYDVFPVTPMQSALIASTLDKSSNYVHQMKWQITDAIDLQRLEFALNQVVNTHQILRTRIASTSLGYYHVIPSQISVSIAVHFDLEKYLKDDLSLGFHLNNNLWFRTALIEEDEKLSYLILTIHHALYDGWCLERIIQDISNAYFGNSPKPTTPFNCYAEYINAQDTEKAKKFWAQKLEGIEPASNFSKTSVQIDLDVAPVEILTNVTVSDLNMASAQVQVTSAVLARAVWAITLSAYTNNSEVIFGNVVSGRDIPLKGVESVVGVLISTIPCRVKIDRLQAIDELLRSILDDYIETTPYSFTNITQIQRWAKISPLFNTTFVYQQFPDSIGSINELPIIALDEDEYMDNFNEFDIQAIITTDEEYVAAMFEFNSKNISRAQITRISEYYSNCLRNVVALIQAGKHSSKVGEIQQLPSTEIEKLDSFGQGNSYLIPYNLGHQAFEKIANTKPHLIAVEEMEKSITYGDLNRKANQMCNLLKDRGIKVGDYVAIVTVRSIEMIISIMGILKAGAAYVPIDHDLPLDRIDYILNTANCHTVLVHPNVSQELKDGLPNGKCVSMDIDSSISSDGSICPANSANVAYVVFTSGSTGKPKGVMISHMSLANLCCSNSTGFDLKEGSRMAQLSSISFDVCVSDIFCSLSNEATLILRQYEDFYEAIRSATVIEISPTALAKMDPIDYPRLQVVAVSGEQCQNSLIGKWAPHVKFLNSYGPTETTVTSSAGVQEIGQMMNVGRPFDNTFQYIVDNDLQLLPIGVPGELLIGGKGVGLGYINRPDLTAERFIRNHFVNDESKMYRTGDICRWTDDGKIQILGRSDDMVKVKGYRIELDEVAFGISQYPLVTGSVVVAKDNMLIAYVTPKMNNTTLLEEFIAESLPLYMCPAYYVTMDEFPTTSNGKIDKKKLRAIDTKVSFQLPDKPFEIILAGIWSQLLYVTLERIGKSTTFFELGGDSISAIQLVFKCKEIGWSIQSSFVYKYPSLERMAYAIEQNLKRSNLVKDVVETSYQISEIIQKEILSTIKIDPEDYEILPCSPTQASLVSQTFKSSGYYCMQMKWKFGFATNKEQLERCLSHLLQSHDVLKSRFAITSNGILQLFKKSKFNVVLNESNHLQTYCKADLKRGFRLEDEFWYRFGLVTTADDQHLVLTIHHALYDGWCLETLVSDIAKSCSGFPITQSKPFTSFLKHLLTKPVEDSKSFWESYLSDLEVVKSLPTSKQGTLSEYAPIKSVIMVPKSELSKACMESGITAASLAKAVWAMVLSMYTQSFDVVFSTVVSGRDASIDGIESIMGMLISTTPCRARILPDCQLHQWLKLVHKDYLETIEHSHVGIQQVKKWMGSTDRPNLFQTMLVFENLPQADDGADKENISMLELLDSDYSSELFNEFDLQILINPMDTCLEVQLDHSPLLGSSFAKRVCDNFGSLLETVVRSLCNQESHLVSEFLKVSETEEQILQRFSQGPTVSLMHETIIDVFEENAALEPSAIAVEEGETSITYGELSDVSSYLAGSFMDQGVHAGDIIAILTTSCMQMIKDILGILKTGAAYIVIDSLLPYERIQYILSTANCQRILVNSAVEESLQRQLKVNGYKFLNRDSVHLPFVAQTILKDSPAYIVFTSGSTGKPKGVVVSHQSLVNLVTANDNGFFVEKHFKVPQIATITFDSSILEIFGTLSKLATLQICVNKDVKTAIKTSNFFVVTPSFLQTLKFEDVPNLKGLIMGGEVCSNTLFEKWSTYCKVYNGYGPSELTVQSSYGTHSTSIGKPMQNTMQYIVSKDLRQVPIGVPGELVIGGIGVGLGYINRPDLTAEKFIPNHFANNGTKMYKTGDICIWQENGEIQFLGRTDHMVKVKGYRIELNEVTLAIENSGLVDSAIVLVRNNELVSFITPMVANIDLIRDKILDTLPYYMIPSVFIKMDRFPLTSHRKVDTLKLLQMKEEERVIIPFSPIEEIVADVWYKVTGNHAPSSFTTFFEIGGDSINITRAIFSLNEKFPKLKLDIKTFYRLQSLNRIAAAIEKSLHIENTTNQLSHKSSIASVDSLLNEPDDMLHQTKLLVRDMYKEEHLKIVCFHGSGSTAEIFSLQLQQIMKELGSKCDFYFIEAPHEVGMANNQLSKYYESKHWYQWWGNKWLGDNFITRKAVKTSLETVYVQLKKIGRVDALLGFSQGASLIELLDRKAQAHEIEKSWNFSILISGLPIKSPILPKKYTKGLPGGIMSPALLVHAVEEREYTMGLLDRYNVDYRDMMEHDKGHEVPRQVEFSRRLSDKILRMATNERKRKAASISLLDNDQIVTSVVGSDWIN